MNWLEKIITRKEKLVVGLMSGTSMDGIDAALVKIIGNGPDSKIFLEDFICVPYEKSLKHELLNLHRNSSPGKLSDLNFAVGEEFSAAVIKLIENSCIELDEVDVIGSHGQTVYHNPPSAGNKSVSTLQLGEADVIAERTGITTVGDFRTRDMAAGGEGAPLIPYVDYILFHDEEKISIAQNIGGIANLTVVTSAPEHVIAFDTGPGNALIDAVVGIHNGWEKFYDESGLIASSGKVDSMLLEKLMDNEYFRMGPPKSTGKEVFGMEFAEAAYSIVIQSKMSFEDLVSTLTQFTVETICHAYKTHIFPRYDIEEIILSGGGARNTEMVRRLKENLNGKKISLTDDYGIPAEAKEAVGFAVLANETVAGNPGNIPGVTGASHLLPLGKISIGSITNN